MGIYEVIDLLRSNGNSAAAEVVKTLDTHYCNQNSKIIAQTIELERLKKCRLTT